MLTDAESYFALQIYHSFIYRNHRRRSAESLGNLRDLDNTIINTIVSSEQLHTNFNFLVIFIIKFLQIKSSGGLSS